MMDDRRISLSNETISGLDILLACLVDCVKQPTDPDVQRSLEAHLAAGAGCFLSEGIVSPNTFWGALVPSRIHLQRTALSIPIQQLHIAAQRQNRRLLASAVRVSEVLKESGHSFALLKGPFLQKQIYGTWCIRPSSDVDLLVPKNEFSLAKDSLVRAGFSSNSDQPVWWEYFLGERHFDPPIKDGPQVDLHWRIQQPGGEHPKCMAAFFNAIEDLEFENTILHACSRSYQCLIQCVHLLRALREGKDAGSYALNLYAILSSLDETGRAELIENAKVQGLERTLSNAVAIVAVAFDCSLFCSSEDRTLGQLGTRKFALRYIFAPSTVPQISNRRFLRMLFHDNTLRLVQEWAWIIASETARRVNV